MRVWRDSGRQNSKLLLYGANTTLGWRILRTIYPREGERGVERGTMREVYDQINGHLIGYQVLGASQQRGDQDLPSTPSAASISFSEMQINAGTAFEKGKSHTAGLPEHRRTERHIPEDRIERVQRKVSVFARVGAAKGDILRAWPK
jgi:hypothetical protein